MKATLFNVLLICKPFRVFAMVIKVAIAIIKRGIPVICRITAIFSYLFAPFFKQMP